VEVGIRNVQMVIFLAPETEEKLGQVTIVTVTEPDATHAGVPMEELAQRWRQTLRLTFSEALWGMEFNRLYPLARQLIVVAILMLAGALELVVLLISKRLPRLRHRVHRLLRTIEITQHDEASEAYGRTMASSAEGEEPAAASSGPPVGEEGDQPSTSAALHRLGKRRSRRWPSLAALERLLDQILANRERFIADLSLRKRLKPDRVPLILNLANLMARVLLLSVIVVLSVGGVGMSLIFPSTREAALFIALQSLAIPLLWMILALAQPLLELVMDQLINMWRTDTELADPGSLRYGLRASTYSELMRMLSGFLFIAVGLYGTILIRGVDPRVLAGAGALVIAIGFRARTLLEDMISGLMIIVRTAAWADGRRALEVIGTTARELRKETEWGELIQEEPAVLGIDEIGDDGTLIRVSEGAGWR
jgi:small conductance mechanosensitive channel